MSQPSIVEPEVLSAVPAPPETLVRYRRPQRVEAPPEAVRPDAAAMAAVGELLPLVDVANELRDARHATRTRKSYALEYAAYEKWLAAKNKKLPVDRQLSAMPAHPATLALYLSYLATTPTRDRHGNVRNARGRSPKGIAVAVAGIANEHRMQRRQSPHHHSDVQDLLAGIANRWAEPLPSDELQKPGTKLGPCASCTHEKCNVARARAKHECAYCRKPIAKFIKQWGAATGMDAKTISGHSPRAGFVTEATRARKRLDKIKDLTGHVETDTLMGYVRDAELFDDNASSGLLSRK